MRQEVLFEVELPPIPNRKLPTNLTTRKHAVHRWMNFTAGYSPEFVINCLEREGTSGLVLDPFAGMGTTLVSANSRHLPAIGFDPHPHAAMMCRAKTQTRSVECIDTIEVLLSGLKPRESVEDFWSEAQLKFLSKLIPDTDELKRLATARSLESSLNPTERPLFRLVVTRLLEGACGAATDGIYKAPTSKKRAIRVEDLLPEVVSQIRTDINEVEANDWACSEVIEDSSERMPNLSSDSVSHIITSPPYLNNFDFAEMSRMELYFWGYANSWGDITRQVRTKLIVNTTTAPTEYKRDQVRWRGILRGSVLDAAQTYVDELSEARAARGGSKDYERLVFPYFAQMQNVLSECYRVLSPGGALDLVVSDSALYGIHIHTERLLAEILFELGYSTVDIVRLRSRGDRWNLAKRAGAKDPLGEFHITARKG